MGLEAAYQKLLRQMKDLAEAVNAVEVMLGDRPVADDVALVDQFDDAVTELQGAIEESLVTLAPLVTLRSPVLLEQARVNLPSQQATVNVMQRTFVEKLAAFARLRDLQRAGKERGGEWNCWTHEAQSTIEACRQPLFRVADALLECWQEFTERTQFNAGVVQTTTIHQPILVPASTCKQMKGMENS